MISRVLKGALTLFAASIVALGLAAALVYWWHTRIADPCTGQAAGSCHSDTVLFVNWPELAVAVLVVLGLCVIVSWCWIRVRGR